MSSRPALRVLIIDDENDIRQMLSMCLTADGHQIVSVASAEEGLAAAQKQSFDLVLLDLRLGTTNGMDLIEPLLAQSRWLRIVVITAFAAVKSAVDAMKLGASDYLPKPFTPAEVKLVVRKIAELRRLDQKAESLREELAQISPAIDYTTGSADMREAVELARRAAESDSVVLISGETGSGKRTLARAIHEWSSRAGKPFAVTGCVAPTTALLESEWFGTYKKLPGNILHEQPGRVHYCEAGTMLIDEIADLPLTVQPKLVRLIQDHEYERHADFSPQKSDVRIIATTTANLPEYVARGDFRSDLMYAMNTIHIQIPPLRRRPDDILPLAEKFIAFFAKQMKRKVSGIDPNAAERLKNHSWPGNVRELRNTIERAVLLAKAEQIRISDLPSDLFNRVNSVVLGDQVTLEQIEELHIRGVLGGSPSIDEAAKILGMDTVTLWRRRKKFGI